MNEHKKISPEYQKYLNSEKWQQIRENILLRDECMCRLCGSKKDLEVHHIRYSNLFHEQDHPEDLMVLCREHHSMISQYWRIADSIKEYYEQKRHEERMRRGLY